MANSAKRLLVVGPSWVGDMVMAQSLFMTLKARYPGATLGVVAPGWSQPILERMPQVDEVLPLAVGHGEFGLASRRELAARLRGRFDRAIVLPRSWKAALVPFMARIPERVGFLGEHRYGLLKERRKLDKQVLDQTVKRFVSLGLPLEEAQSGQFTIPKPRLTIDRDNLVNLRLSHALSSRPAIGMMPGAEYGPAKQWPLAYFHQLAAKLIKEGFEVRVLGGAKDHAAGRCRGFARRLSSSGHERFGPDARGSGGRRAHPCAVWLVIARLYAAADEQRRDPLSGPLLFAMLSAHVPVGPYELLERVRRGAGISGNASRSP